MNKQVSVSTHCRVSFSLVLTFIPIITNIGESCKRYLPPFVAALAVSVSAFKRLKVCMKKKKKKLSFMPQVLLTPKCNEADTTLHTLISELSLPQHDPLT